MLFESRWGLEPARAEVNQAVTSNLNSVDSICRRVISGPLVGHPHQFRVADDGIDYARAGRPRNKHHQRVCCHEGDARRSVATVQSLAQAPLANDREER
jgi:hypothetical protein